MMEWSSAVGPRSSGMQLEVRVKRHDTVAIEALPPGFLDNLSAKEDRRPMTDDDFPDDF